MADTNRFLAGPAGKQFTVTPSDTADLEPRPRALRVTVGGNLTLMDEDGTTITYPTVIVGEIIPFSAKRVMATGTTATVVGWI